MEFVNLHNHTHYSIGMALTTPKELIRAAYEDNHKAVAITDIGVMYGAYEFYSIARSMSVKPIIGIETYVLYDPAAGYVGPKLFKLLLLARDNRGYKNLMKIASIGEGKRDKYRSVVTKDILLKYRSGLIALSGGYDSIINYHIINSNIEKAIEEVSYYKLLFGNDYYLEIQDHGLSADDLLKKSINKLAIGTGVSLVAANESFYLNKDHAIAHNVLLMSRQNKRIESDLSEINDLRLGSAEFYFKSQEEINALFEDYPNAIQNTMEISEKCEPDYLQTKIFMPEIKHPLNFESNHEYLKDLVWKEVNEKYAEINSLITERVTHELQIIDKMGLTDYFLAFRDIIEQCRKFGIRVGPGRGPAPGSIVNFALGITAIDPLQYGLHFERFINCDILFFSDLALDIQDNKRHLIIEYLRNKYGRDSVANVITFVRKPLQTVVAELGNILNIKHYILQNIIDNIPKENYPEISIKNILGKEEFARYYNAYEEKFNELIEISSVLQNRIYNTDIHPGGTIITPDDLRNHVPVIKYNTDEYSFETVTQYSINDCEDNGLMKFNIFELKPLSVIDITLGLIKETHRNNIDINQISLSDKTTYKLLSNGDTFGIFQFESIGFQGFLKELQPDNIEDLAALNMLYYYGLLELIPEFIGRKIGSKPFRYLHREFVPVLENTYGLLIYEEQFMSLVNRISGQSLSWADILRRAIGKRQRKMLREMKEIFINSAQKNNIQQSVAENIFRFLYDHCKYLLKKSHAMAYSLIDYQMAWLKANYTAEFFAANLIYLYQNRDKNRIFKFKIEAKKSGILDEVEKMAFEMMKNN